MIKIIDFLKAVKKGDCQKTAELLQNSLLNVNQLDPKSGKTALQIAMEEGHDDVFECLLQAVDIEVLSKQGESSLETAVLLNNAKFVARILEVGVKTGANLRRKNKDGHNALSLAVQIQTSQEILQRLIQYKFDVNERLEYFGSYVNLAIKEGQSQNVLFLLKNKAKYTITDEDDNTSLILAVKHNRGDVTVALLEHLLADLSLAKIEKQFFINAQNKDGNTALHQACLKGLQTISDLLIRTGKQVGIDLTIRNKAYLTAQQIRSNQEKNRRLGLQLQRKKSEQRNIRKKEKQQQKIKQREQADARQKEQEIEEKRREALRAKAQIVESKIGQKKTQWILCILFVIVLGVMYLMFVKAADKAKQKIML